MDDFAIGLDRSWALALALSVSFAAAGCADAERLEPPLEKVVDHNASFVGHVYDGASGARLSDYDISALVDLESIAGERDEDGRYRLGDIGVWQDYTIAIEAEGYRTFRSHNARVGLPSELAQSDDIADIATHQTLHFDAYLFPSSIEAPPVTFTVTTPLGGTPSGTVRFRPISSSLLADDPLETPSGVPTQVWTNDEDLLAASLVEDFSGGEISLASGALVYGVTYQVDIYAVTGFQPFSATYTAGVETDKTFQLTEELAEPLAVITSTHESCVPPASPANPSGAVVTIELNHEIEAHDSGYPGGASEAADDGISITSPDDDVDTVVNALNSDISDNAQERGVSLMFAGKTLTISWSPVAGLETSDLDDAITQVSYAGLANIVIRRVGSPSSATSLATLLGVSAITCD